jgi:hypothetical protein
MSVSDNRALDREICAVDLHFYKAAAVRSRGFTMAGFYRRMTLVIASVTPFF